jgi:hypothetical protein
MRASTLTVTLASLALLGWIVSHNPCGHDLYDRAGAAPPVAASGAFGGR